MRILVRGKRADTSPIGFKEIQIECLILGEEIKLKNVEQAIKLTEEKYCSVGFILRATTDINPSYKVPLLGQPII